MNWRIQWGLVSAGMLCGLAVWRIAIVPPYSETASVESIAEGPLYPPRLLQLPAEIMPVQLTLEGPLQHSLAGDSSNVKGPDFSRPGVLLRLPPTEQTTEASPLPAVQSPAAETIPPHWRAEVANNYHTGTPAPADKKETSSEDPYEDFIPRENEDSFLPPPWLPPNDLPELVEPYTAARSSDFEFAEEGENDLAREFAESLENGPPAATLNDRPRGSRRVPPAVARQSEAHVEKAFSLAARGANFSARSELVAALGMIAQALDVEVADQPHSRLLAEGLTALSEAEDFVPQGSRLEANLKLDLIVARHTTPVLKSVPKEELTALRALQEYYAFAQQRLTWAVGEEPAASRALMALGKLQPQLGVGLQWERLAGPRAMVFHQAAVEVDPRNHLAANELGVWLARYGQYEHARTCLLQSVKVAPAVEAWHNLAVVHRQLGETELAGLADQEAQRAARANLSHSLAGPPAVQWVSPEAFNRTQQQGAAVPNRPAPSLQPTPAPNAQQNDPAGLTARKPWKFAW